MLYYCCRFTLAKKLTTLLLILNFQGLGTEWERLDNMMEPRADHACAVMQHFYGKKSKVTPPWTMGIMVTGGYRLRGAWTSSVEFLDFRTGKTYYIKYYNKLIFSINFQY